MSGIKRWVNVVESYHNICLFFLIIQYETDTCFGSASKFIMKYKGTWELIELISERDGNTFNIQQDIEGTAWIAIEYNCHSESSTG